MKSFAGKVAVITGAGGNGIGHNVAVELAKQGAHIAFCDVANLESTTAAIAQYGVKVYSEIVDIGNKESINTFVKNVLATFNHVDILVNNAGIALGDRDFADVTEADFEKITNINYWGVVHTTQILYKHMLSRPEAAVVNLSSAQGILALPSLVPYCTTKFAVRGFTDALRTEHAIKGHNSMTFHCVHPGRVATNITLNADYHGKNTERFHQDLQKGVTANDAAKDILRGIQRNKNRIFVSDGRSHDIIARLFPGG